MKKMSVLFAFLLLGAVANAQFLEIGPAGQRAPRLVEGIPAAVPPAVVMPASPRPPLGGPVDPLLAQLLQHTLDSLRAAYNPIGLSAALALPDGSLWEGATGINSTAPGDSLHPGLLLGIGSVSKNLLAATVLRLAEDGLLSLEDSLGRWVPSSPNVNGSISLRRLLNHTSGIANYTDNPAFWGQVNANLGMAISPSFILQNFVGAPLFAPGASWSYSNTNYLLLGLVVEAVAEAPFHEAMRGQLLDPEGLGTAFLLPQENAPQPLSHMWVDINGDGVPDNFTGISLPLTAIFTGAWAAGAYCSNAADMAVWIKRLMEGEVLQPASLAEMMTGQQVTPAMRYGLGLYRLNVQGRAWWGHDGYLFYQALVLYQPELGIGMALLSNDGEFEEMGPVFLELAEVYERYLDMLSAAPSIAPMGVEVSPNPFADELAITFGEAPRGGSAQLLDAQGRMLAATVIPEGLGSAQAFRWSLPGLPSGLYILRLQANGRSTAMKLLKP